MNTARAEDSVNYSHIIISAIEALQIKLISPSQITAADIHTAVGVDLNAGIPLNQTVLIKLFSSPRVKLSTHDYQKIALLLREALIKLPMTKADLFINYAQCSAACMKHSQ